MYPCAGGVRNQKRSPRILFTRPLRVYNPGMTLTGECDGRPFAAVVALRGGGAIVTIGRRRWRVALPAFPGPLFDAAVGGRRRRAGAWREGDRLRVLWDGRLHAVRFADRLAALERALPSGRGASGGPVVVAAPIPGLVTAVAVRPGDRVEKGRRLLGLDAMKLENIIESPRDGVVRAVQVKPGQAVERGAPLVTIG
jgi:acetyl/propionyl-CoA carboxylase alpha subunit